MNLLPLALNLVNMHAPYLIDSYVVVIIYNLIMVLFNAHLSII